MLVTNWVSFVVLQFAVLKIIAKTVCKLWCASQFGRYCINQLSMCRRSGTSFVTPLPLFLKLRLRLES